MAWLVVFIQPKLLQHDCDRKKTTPTPQNQNLKQQKTPPNQENHSTKHSTKENNLGHLLYKVQVLYLPDFALQDASVLLKALKGILKKKKILWEITHFISF